MRPDCSKEEDDYGNGNLPFSWEEAVGKYDDLKEVGRL